MGNLSLVRHGQASFGAADYDNLSELGRRQSVRLGEYFAGKGLQFESVITGTLKRHAQTWAGIAQGAGLTQWMNGVVTPQGMPAYNDFVHGVTSALDHVRKSHTGNVLIVSSGGPISTAVGHILGTSPETAIELNLRIRNSSVTELAYTPKRHMLVTYNTLPHLDDAAYADWVTYS